MDELTNDNSEGGSQDYTKTWIIEWTSSLGKKSHQEKDDYSLALELFNERSKQGEVLLYEIQKSLSDGSILKKTPVLNSKKAKKRKEEAVKKVMEQSEKGKRKIILSNTKLRIIILASVIGALLMILFLITAFTNTGNVISHHAILHVSDADGHFYSFEINEIYYLADRL